MEGSVMEEKFYIVSAKCGHVGRKNYITIDFPVKATSGKEAAQKAKQQPRVKRHRKDAIESVYEVSKGEYQKQRLINNQDNYLKVKSKQGQKQFCTDLHKRIKKHKVDKDEQYQVKRKARVQYQMKKRAIELELNYSF